MSIRTHTRATIVPTKATRHLARVMVAEAQQEPGADVVLKHIQKVPSDQLPALIGVLLTATKAHRKLGRPRVPDAYTAEQRLEATRRYKNGERTPWVIDGWREYNRHRVREHRARHGRSTAA